MKKQKTTATLMQDLAKAIDRHDIQQAIDLLAMVSAQLGVAVPNSRVKRSDEPKALRSRNKEPR